MKSILLIIAGQLICFNLFANPSAKNTCQKIIKQYKKPTKKELTLCQKVLLAYLKVGKKNKIKPKAVKSKFQKSFNKCVDDHYKAARKKIVHKIKKQRAKLNKNKLIRHNNIVSLCLNPKTITFISFWDDVFKLFQNERKINKQRLRKLEKMIPFNG